MITDLETLLNEDQFRELVKAINENREYNYENNGLKINSKSDDNSLQLSIAYDGGEGNLVKKELDNFQNYLKNLDDDLFTEICDALGNSEIQKIQNCLNSDKLETIRAAIIKFKNFANKIITNKIAYFKNLLYA